MRDEILHELSEWGLAVIVTVAVVCIAAGGAAWLAVLRVMLFGA